MMLAFLIRSGFSSYATGRRLRNIAAMISLMIMGNAALAQQDLFDHFKRVDDESELKAGETMEGKIKKNFFLKAEVNKTECFAGESIMATFKAYSRLNATSQVVKRPSLTGFSVLEMVDGYSNQPGIEKINGKYFYAHLIRKVQLIPLQAGTFNLDGAEVESVIHFTRNNDGEESAIKSLRDFLRKAASRHEADETLDYRVNLETPPIGVRVIPLPEPNKDIDFSGAVGQFSLELQMPDKKIKPYEPAIVRLVVRGSGNFPLITEPAVKWPEEADVSPPTVTEEVNKYVFPLAGTKTFEYSLEAKNTGEYIIPPMRFSYFDPSAKTYRTIQTQAVAYSVIPEKDNRNSLSTSGNDTPEYSSGLPRQFYWFAGVAVIIIGWIIFQLFRLREAKKTTENSAEKVVAAITPPLEDDTAIKRKDALDKNMAIVKESLNEGDQRAFYNHVQRAIWEAIGDRYTIAPSALTKRLMVQLMSKDHFPDPVIENTIGLLNECDLALYTPDQNQADMLNTYLLLESWLREIQLNYN